MSLRIVQTEWPAGFKAGNAVTHRGRAAHVVAVPEGIVPAGCVPIMYDDEANCFVATPADDLNRR